MIKNSPWTGGTDEEYEAQHFGFGSQRLKIAVRQMVEQKIIAGVKNMETHLKESLDLNDTDRQTLTQSCDKLISLYCENAGSSLDIIDNEIEKSLKIPHNTLLPEDEMQFSQVSDEEFEKLKEEVCSLRRGIERAALMEYLLKAEEEELASVEKVCQLARKDMEVVELFHKNISKTESTIKKIQSDNQFLSELVSPKNGEEDFFCD